MKNKQCMIKIKEVLGLKIFHQSIKKFITPHLKYLGEKKGYNDKLNKLIKT